MIEIKDILQALGATGYREVVPIQELWGGYGFIKRIELVGSSHQSVILKQVQAPENEKHPRGWEGNLSFKRKIKSYQVELAWYRSLADSLSPEIRVASSYFQKSGGDQKHFSLVLEDLSFSGFPVIKQICSEKEIKTCLEWLAGFHSFFLGCQPEGLWEVGTYWHLDTRPDEYEAIKDINLKASAGELDTRLNQCQFKTIVHGDAKLANFCFSECGTKVAAVDFQYVGGGCGVKDIAYFLTSVLSDSDWGIKDIYFLEIYLERLGFFLQSSRGESISKQVVEEWRGLYPVALVDFYRFLKGWCPGHQKLNDFSESLISRVLAEL